MAERRMFARSVIGSARFLRMPTAARLLYYDLGMQADDDGVVEAFAVLRTTGASEDALEVLEQNGFVRRLNEDLVTYISDWNRNNYIQKDRYRPSVYQALLLDTGCIPSVSEPDTQDRIGKDRIEQDRKREDRRERAAERGDGKPAPPEAVTTHPHFVPPTVEEVAEYVAKRGSRIDPQGFLDFYASKGWLIGKTPMKDWKAACRNAEHWERWNTPNTNRHAVKTTADYENGEDFFS